MFKKKYNIYDLNGKYGIGYTLKGEEFYFDLEDYDKIKNYCWYIENGGGRVCTHNPSRKTPYKLHRLILDITDPKITIDHKNRNQRDNRKSNLRICTSKENSYNHKVSKSNNSGKTGVHFRKDTNKYTSYIMVDNKMIYLGCYKNIEDAINIRLKAEKKYFGEFAPIDDKRILEI